MFHLSQRLVLMFAGMSCAGFLLMALPGCSDDAPTGTNDTSQNVETKAPSHQLAHLWPPVRVHPTSIFDFGQVMLNQPVTREVELLNSGDVDVHLANARSNCGCTTADVSGMVIPANGSLMLPVHFDAEGRVGSRSATVTLEFVDWERPITFRIQAEVVRP